MLRGKSVDVLRKGKTVTEGGGRQLCGVPGAEAIQTIADGGAGGDVVVHVGVAVDSVATTKEGFKKNTKAATNLEAMKWLNAGERDHSGVDLGKESRGEAIWCA